MYPQPPLYTAAAAAALNGGDGAGAVDARSPLRSPVFTASAIPAHRSFIDIKGADEWSPEGRARPGFFRGVSTVVCKLLSIVRPTVAVFGQKDGQQCIVVKSLVRDLNLMPLATSTAGGGDSPVPTGIIIGPTSRADDGLALSSRNAYLSPQQRAVAPAIYRALCHVQGALTGTEEGRALVEEARAAREAALARLAAGGRGSGSGDSGGAGSATLSAERAAQMAARAQAQAAGTSAQPASMHPILSRLLAEASDIILSARNPQAGDTTPGNEDAFFSSIDYLAFSDAATGVPITDLAHSTAANGAVMLSVAARMGGIRLLDNAMVIGGVDDLGEPYYPTDRDGVGGQGGVGGHAAPAGPRPRRYW